MLTEIKQYPRSPKGDYQFSILIPSWNNLPYLQLRKLDVTRQGAPVKGAGQAGGAHLHESVPL